VRELKRFGLLQDDRMVLRGSIRWPELSRIVGSRYWLELDFAGRDTMQRVRVSWTRCHMGGWRPWMHCPYCDKPTINRMGTVLVCLSCVDRRDRLRSPNARLVLPYSMLCCTGPVLTRRAFCCVGLRVPHRVTTQI
jgi:hypothetical protein